MTSHRTKWEPHTIKWQIEIARQELVTKGWTIIPDEGRTGSLRGQVTKGFTGRYISYFDPEVRGIVIALRSKLREALGI